MAEAANKSQRITQGKIVSDKSDLSWDMLSCSFSAFSLTPPAPHTAEPGLLSSLVIRVWSNSSGALGCEFVLTNTNMWIYSKSGATASLTQSAPCFGFTKSPEML